MSTATLTDRYTTTIKCLAQQKTKSLSLRANHHTFGNTLDLGQVMLTNNKLHRLHDNLLQLLENAPQTAGLLTHEGQEKQRNI